MTGAGPRPTFRWTREEFYRLEELGFFIHRHAELIHGEIFEKSPDDPAHAAAITLLEYTFEGTFGAGFVVRNQTPLSIGLDSDPQPDISVVKGDLRDYLKSHPAHAALVVEVAGASLEYDRTTKASLYAEAGIPEYWIVHLADPRVEVFRMPREDPKGAFGFGFGEREAIHRGQSISPLALPGISIAVDAILP